MLAIKFHHFQSTNFITPLYPPQLSLLAYIDPYKLWQNCWNCMIFLFQESRHETLSKHPQTNTQCFTTNPKHSKPRTEIYSFTYYSRWCIPYNPLHIPSLCLPADSIENKKLENLLHQPALPKNNPTPGHKGIPDPWLMILQGFLLFISADIAESGIHSIEQRSEAGVNGWC